MPRPPYLDSDLSTDVRAKDLLGRMTLREKAGLLFHTAVSILPDGSVTTQDDPKNAEVSTASLVLDRAITHLHIWNGEDAEQVVRWHNAVQEMAESTRLGIPVTVATDPRHGMRSTPFTGLASGAVSRWPEHTGIAATANEQLTYEYGDVVRRELTAMGIRVYLGPMADLFTDPRWSRGFGTFGEDPELVSRLTAAFIRGLRGGENLGPQSVAAVVKHFPGGGPQKGGHDAHDSRYREQVYPGHQEALHLQPFEAAFAAGATQVMPYYGMPIGTSWDEVGFAFNRPVITDLLRERYGFEGIVCTDWFLLEQAMVDGMGFGPNGYGLEDLTASERIVAALEAGVDQFGGDSCTELVVDLVEAGRLPESRIDESALRLLREKVQLGLFENRRVDGAVARKVVGSAAYRAKGLAAQRASLVLLRNEMGPTRACLPVSPDATFYAEGVGTDFGMAPSTPGKRVDSAEDADVIVVRLDSPWEPSGGPLGDVFHGGTLEFSDATTERILDLCRIAPTVLVVYLERPAVLTPFLGYAQAVIGEFGATDEVVFDAIFGKAPITGRLPFDLPSSDAAVESSREDVPFDTDLPAFRFGDAIVLDEPAGAVASGVDSE